MAAARSDATGNFLLLRRGADGAAPTAAAAGCWPAPSTKYHSSPTHTVDSGYDDGQAFKSRGHVTLNQVNESKKKTRNTSDLPVSMETLQSNHRFTRWR